MEDIWMDNQAFSFTTGLSPIYFIRALKRQHYILLLYYILYAIFAIWLGQYTLLSAAFCFFILVVLQPSDAAKRYCHPLAGIHLCCTHYCLADLQSIQIRMELRCQ